ncbi:endonuclease/exonuclease/phosphatase family protein [Planctomycetota bacterium]
MNYFRNILLLIIIVFLFGGCWQQPQNTPLKVMTFNIRYDNPADGLNAWGNRKEMVAEAIKSHDIDIVGMQEVLKHQEDFLIESLPEYDSYGVGRDDGVANGELNSIFFRKERYELLEKSTFWLSETPEVVGSRGWDASLSRIASWVKLHDRLTNRDLFFFNTHFSHVGPEARKNSAQLLIDKIAEIAGDHAVILTGDFNCNNQSEPYRLLTGSRQDMPRLYDTHFISETDHFGGLQSINGFRETRRESIIDFVFCNSNFRVLEHGILTIKKKRVFISDHYPVMAVVVLSNG